MKLLKCPIAVIVVFALALAAAQAAERKSDDGPQWPNIRTDDIDFPSQSLNKHPSFTDPEEVTDRILGRSSRDTKRGARNIAPASDVDVTGSTARWPNVHLDDDAPAPRPNPHPSFIPPAAKAAARPDHPTPSSEALAADTSGGAARWPTLRAEPVAASFSFEAGVRYWYSTGSIKFNFTNNDLLFGSPTSTLFWHGMNGQTGEAFARFDHRSSGVFAKGMVGGGWLTDGHIVDEDFLVHQFKLSDTTSDVTTGNTRFAMFDAGWAYWPVPDFRLGFFGGYHYWQEQVAASGLVCNQASVLGCPAAGAVLLTDSTAVFRYQPTWHAARVGVDAKYIIGGGWSVSGEFAVVPYAYLVNQDSHLQRQDFSDLGPAPNVISKSTYAFGAETELFVNYAVTPNIEIGAGVRYWGLSAAQGGVRFGPLFSERDNLNSFNEQRYGVLAHVKGTF